MSDAREDAVALGVAVRDLMDAAVLTTADGPERTAVAAELQRLAARLRDAGVRDTMPLPDIEGMRRGDRPFSPVIGPANPIAPPMQVRPDGQGGVVAEVTLRPIHEGPAGAVHGGWVATLLDQTLGHANTAAGAGGFTAELTVRYLRPTPYGVPLTIRARTDEVDGRRVRASGEIEADGVVTAEARGLFLTPTPDRAAALQDAIAARAGGSA